MINWMQGISQINSVPLRPVADQLRVVSQSFEQSYYTHIYGELKVEADAISKGGQNLAEGDLALEEIKDGIAVSSMRRL